MDADRSNSITPGEFQIGLRSAGIHLLDQEIERVFDGVDKDHDGRVSWDEIQIALFPGEKVTVTPHPPPRQRRTNAALPPGPSKELFASESSHNATEKALDRLRAKAAIAGIRPTDASSPVGYEFNPMRQPITRHRKYGEHEEEGEAESVDGEIASNGDEDRVTNLRNQIYFLELETALLRKQCMSGERLPGDDTKHRGENNASATSLDGNAKLMDTSVPTGDADIDSQLDGLRAIAKRRERTQERLVQKFQSEIERLKTEIGVADERAQRFDTDAAAAQEKYNEGLERVQKQHADDLRRIASLELRLKNADADLEKLRSHHAAARIAESEERSRLREQLGTARSRSRDLQDELVASTVREKSASDALEKLQEQLAVASVETERAQAEASKAKDSARDDAAEIDALREELARAKHQIRQVEASRDAAMDECELTRKKLVVRDRELKTSAAIARDAVGRCEDLEKSLVEARVASKEAASRTSMAEAVATKRTDSIVERAKQIERLELSGFANEEHLQRQGERLADVTNAAIAAKEALARVEKDHAELAAEGATLRESVRSLENEAKRSGDWLRDSREREGTLRAEVEVLRKSLARMRAFTKLHDSQKELAALSQSTFSAAESMRHLLEAIAAPETKHSIADIEAENEGAEGRGDDEAADSVGVSSRAGVEAFSSKTAGGYYHAHDE
eukprot:g2727.t1